MGRRRLAAAIVACCFTLICPASFAQEEPVLNPNGPPDAAHVAAAELAIHEQALRGHIRFLASDLLEGRGTGSRGDELAQHYIAAQFESLRLKPILPDNSWFQSVPLVGVIRQHSPHSPRTLRRLG